MQTKISVIIPTFRRPKLLTRCLNALLEQQLHPAFFEVIVVSDGPDPDTRNALLPFLNNKLNLHFLQSPQKKGPASARNYGWLMAKSTLVAFTDDDCSPHPNWLQAFLEQYKGQELVAFAGQTLVPLPKCPTDYELNTSNLENAEFITANCACTKKALFKVGGFDERFRTAWREDSDLQFNFISTDIPIIKVNRAIVLHPVRTAHWGISIREQKKGLYDALLYRKFPELYRLKIQTAQLWTYYLINICWFGLFLSLSLHVFYISIFLLSMLGIFFTLFVVKRLKKTSKSFQHIAEMIYTSLLIPTVSVFWRLYGAFKFRVIFI